jgi:hypothetical protein
MVKKLTCLLIMTLLLLSLFGCTSDKDDALTALDDDQAATVQEDLAAFSGGNISEITERVFGEGAGDGSFDNSSDGVIADLFAYADVKIVATDETTISYIIVSPDISDFFVVCADQLDSIMTSDELGQAIMEYAKAAPMKEYAVTISYSVVDDEININYSDPNFINAMTGGLLEAYSALYDQYLTEQG